MVSTFLNELSVGSSSDRFTASVDMSAFVDCLKSLNRLFKGLTLCSKVSLNGQMLSPDFNYHQWRNLPENHDAHSFISRLLAKAPSYDFNRFLEGNSNYYFADLLAYGLAAAHFDDGLAVSIAGTESLKVGVLQVVLAGIEMDALGHEDVKFVEVAVRNAWNIDLSAHAEWLGEMQSALADAVWARSVTLEVLLERCDSLVFLPSAYAQLSSLEGRARTSAFETVALLQASAAGWDPSQSTLPNWLTKVTPESQSRLSKNLVSFNDSDGTPYDFGWHARYTPTAGRIHFRIDYERRQLRIAYVGVKIE